jgi:hypothetical protein
MTPPDLFAAFADSASIITRIQPQRMRGMPQVGLASSRVLRGMIRA